MVKSVLSVYHAGLRDWLVQRVSAVIMAVYSVGLMLFFACHRHLDYSTWHAFFSHEWVKIATALMILALLWHAWVGVWTILTDYIKPFLLRLVLHLIVLLSLVAFFFIGLQILWGI